MKGLGINDAARLVLGRSRGICERCAERNATDIHHRRPRGMGGTRHPEIHSPANLLHLCADCHRWVESNSRAAYEFGWKVPHNTLDPVEVPVKRRHVWVYLTREATVEMIEQHQPEVLP